MIYITRIVSMGYIVPEDEDQKEYWTWKPAGSAPWFIRLCQDPHRVFGHTEKDEEIREITSNQSSFDDNAKYPEPQIEKTDETIGTREVRVPIPRGSLDKGLGGSYRS
jgi:adenine/guanine/hypoxanthine permease